ncbi:MAG TPA: hypothetical protein VFO15_18045 [Xanthobacteraceae bacterium]|nr:hypothetical protein [Xanthobacteraceae bacterium]
MTVTFHKRDSLGLGQPVLSRLAARSDADLHLANGQITWHHTGADGTLYHPDPIARLRGIWEYHVHTLGYGDIAYEGAFDADANTYGLRDGRWIGAHAGSTGNVANRQTNGIVFLEDARGITHGALEAFTWWVNLSKWVSGGHFTEYAHRWWSKGHGGTGTECPGDDWDAVVRFTGGNW